MDLPSWFPTFLTIPSSISGVTGIVPQFCDKLFKGIEDKRAEGADAQFEVNLLVSLTKCL